MNKFSPLFVIFTALYSIVHVGLMATGSIPPIVSGPTTRGRAETATESPSTTVVVETAAPTETSVIIEGANTWTNVREDGVLVVTVESTDEVATDAASAPIVALDDNDALLDAGLQVGDEVLRVSDGFESVTVHSAGTLDEAFTRIAAAVDDNDSYLDVLVRRGDRNLMITVAAMPST